MDFKCNICSRLFKLKRALSYHVSTTHHLTPKEYYDTYLKTDLQGLCKICGEKTNFNHGKYNSYCSTSCKFKDAQFVEKIKQSARATNLIKYGVEYNSQADWHRKLVSNKWKNKTSEQIKKITDKTKSTTMQKYGVSNSAKRLDVILKIKNTKLNYSEQKKNEISEKTKKTNLQKYGVDNVWKSKKIIRKIKKTKMERYGTLYFQQTSSISKISQRLFWNIMQKFKDILQDVNFHDLNKEYTIRREKNGKKIQSNWYYDFTCHNLHKIIEFDGQVFHPSDSIQDGDANWSPFKKISAGEMRHLSQLKDECAIQHGYQVLHVRESEYLKDPEQVYNKISLFLKGVLK